MARKETIRSLSTYFTAVGLIGVFVNGILLSFAKDKMTAAGPIVAMALSGAFGCVGLFLPRLLPKRLVVVTNVIQLGCLWVFFQVGACLTFRNVSPLPAIFVWCILHYANSQAKRLAKEMTDKAAASTHLDMDVDSAGPKIN